MKIICVLSLLLCNIVLYAEEVGDKGGYASKKYSVIPPSPEVSSMMKYIDIPVSHFTGQPQIEIPVYTILSSK